MNIKITGKDLKVTDSIKEYVEKKMERVQKYFDEELEVAVTIKKQRELQIAEIRVNTNIDIYKAVTEHKDLYASIDKDIDILEGQIRKTKAKKEKQIRQDTIKDMGSAISKNETEIENEILKTSYYEMKPMAPEDAKIKLEEENNLFFTFVNIETNKVNVLFKLKDGKNYGLIEPEL